jgi:hypothetical protein
VVTTRLARELDGDRWVPPETHRRVLLAPIHAFIQQHLGDPELSPGEIAAAHDIVQRPLHKLFQEQGETVAAGFGRGGWRAAGEIWLTRHRPPPPAAAAARWLRSAIHFSRVSAPPTASQLRDHRLDIPARVIDKAH